MKKIALFGIIALSTLMVGCTTTSSTSSSNGPTICDGTDCPLEAGQACADASQCDKSSCDKQDCPKAAACASKKACGPDCTKPCCADKAACTHANTAFACPNGACTADKPCCGDCAAKIAELCPDCKA